MMRGITRLARLLVALCFASLCANAVSAAEIKVLNANALTIAMKEIAAGFTQTTGHQVTFVGVSPGQVDQRLRAGESYDIVINAAAAMAAYDKEGRLRADSRRPLVRVGLG